MYVYYYVQIQKIQSYQLSLDIIGENSYYVAFLLSLLPGIVKSSIEANLFWNYCSFSVGNKVTVSFYVILKMWWKMHPWKPFVTPTSPWHLLSPPVHLCCVFCANTLQMDLCPYHHLLSTVCSPIKAKFRSWALTCTNIRFLTLRYYYGFVWRFQKCMNGCCSSKDKKLIRFLIFSKNWIFWILRF